MAGLEVYFQAYQDLQTERFIGMSAGPIPWSAIHRYGEYLGFDADGIEVLVSHVRAMEHADREFEERKQNG